MKLLDYPKQPKINEVPIWDLFYFLYDIYSNYDCDEDAHRLQPKWLKGVEPPSGCRACQAELLIKRLGYEVRG